jgi:micrococcal nuclease
MRRVVGTCALFAAALAGCGLVSEGALTPPLGPGEAIVERVVDGDTVRVDTGGDAESVRLIGIDTPESVDPRQPVQCFGREASAHTKSLLPEGARVRLERDAELRDRFGRVLAYVFRADDGLFVNEAIVAGGFAQVLTVPPNVAYQERFVRAAAQARAHRRGLWSACGGGSVPA